MPSIHVPALLAAAVLVSSLGCVLHPPAELQVLYPFERRVAVRFNGDENLLHHLTSVPRSNADRARQTARLFRRAGCRRPDLVTAPVAGDGEPNIVCTLPGRSTRTIVVTAHYERRVESKGIVDNWTGAVMLPSLYYSLSQAVREHSYVFVATADPTTDAKGALSFVRSLAPEALGEIAGVVSLYALGLGPLAAEAPRADPNLWLDLVSVSRAMSLDVRNHKFLTEVHDDTRPFRREGVPTLMLHSFDAHTAPIATRDPSLDRGELVIAGEYVESYRLIAFYLAYLDASLTARLEGLGVPPAAALGDGVPVGEAG